MSANLAWMPVVTQRHKTFDDDVKWVFRDRLGDGRMTLGMADIGYLRGLLDGGCKGAQAVINAVEKHGEIEIWLAY